MKLHLLAGAAIAALAVVATGAAAEQAPGWYGALDLGYNSLSKYKARCLVRRWRCGKPT